MNILAFIIGIALPTINGWLLLYVLQQPKRVLFKGEQWAMGAATGLLFTMLITFIVHSFAHIPLSTATFLSIQISLILLIGAAAYFLQTWKMPAPVATPSDVFSLRTKVIVGIFGAWVLAKTILPAVVFLALTPTYLDDTLDNWNLRGKVFFHDQALTLAMPSEDPLTSPLGVSSYSPAVPLMKTWLARLAGEWNEGLVNSIHVVWYIVALTLLYYALRRITPKIWALLGTYILASMPLYLMHGTNPYADAFMSVHVFLAVSMMFFFLQESHPDAKNSYMKIGALCTGLLPFTKNEGLLLFLPPLLLVLGVGLLLQWKKGTVNARTFFRAILWYGLVVFLLTIPWLGFKLMNGLTFGNAKPVDSLGFGLQQGVAIAWFVNTFAEGNWLLLFPLVCALLLWRWRAAFTTYVVPVSFFLIVYLGQLFLFFFTGLAVEARMQTGLARGVVQLLPVIVCITGLLLWDARATIVVAFASNAQAERNR